MSFLMILGIALALAMDAFAVSLGMSCGLLGLKRAQVLRLALAFGLSSSPCPSSGGSPAGR